MTEQPRPRPPERASSTDLDAAAVRVALGPPPASFADFYRREFPAMVALASTLVGRSAEDIAQEAMIRAHQRWGSISTYDRPGAWVRRVTINLATSRLRRRAVQLRALTSLLDGVPAVEFPAEATFDDHITAAINALPRNQRIAVALHYLEDLAVDDIANVIGCAPATAKVHLHRGRKSLAARLGREGELKNEEGMQP